MGSKQKLTETEKNFLQNIFSKGQAEIIIKKTQGTKLDATERSVYSHYIKPKLRGLMHQETCK